MAVGREPDVACDDLLKLSRRSFVSGVVGAATAMTAPFAPAWSAEGGEKVLTISLPNNPATFDPVNSFNHDAMAVTQTIFENLVELDVDGNLRPQLAVSLPTISSDHKVYTFDLRDDVYFHDGQKLSGDDVKDSFDWLLDPKNKAARRTLFNRISRIVVESPTRVRFELSEPYRPWLYYLTKYMGIWPKGARDKNGADYFKVSPIGVGTGPGVFVEWRQNDYVMLKKFDKYWRKDVPHWDRLVVRIVAEDTVRVAYLMTGQVDISSAPPPKDFVRLRTFQGLKGESRPSLGGWFFLFTNTKKPPFDDWHARKAVSHAIDRADIAKNVFYGLVDPAAVPAPPTGWWFSKAASDANDYDLDKAKAHLKESKYPDGFEFEMMLPAQPYLLDVKDAAVVLQSQLAKLNIKINMRVTEQSVLQDALLSGNNVSALQVWLSPGDPTFVIDLCYGKNNNVYTKSSGYESPALWQTIQESYVEDDPKALKPIFERMQQILANDSPHIWMGFVHVANLWRDSVKGFKVSQGLTMNVREVEKA